MALADRMAATVTRLLSSDKGREVVLRRSVRTYDPDEGEMSGSSPKDLATVGADIDLSNHYLQGALIEGVEAALIVDASIAPLITDRVLDGANEIAILKIGPIKVGGVAVAYTLQLGK